MLNTRCGSQKTIQSLQSVQVHGLMFIVELEASQSCFSFFGRRTKTANFAFAHNSYHDMTRIVTTDDGKSWMVEWKYHFLIKAWRWDFWNSNQLTSLCIFDDYDKSPTNGNQPNIMDFVCWRYKIQRFKCVWANQTILFHCFLELLPELIFWKCCFEPKFVGSESWNVEIKLPLMFLSLAAYSQKKEITFLHKMLLPAKKCCESWNPNSTEKM